MDRKTEAAAWYLAESWNSSGSKRRESPATETKNQHNATVSAVHKMDIKTTRSCFIHCTWDYTIYNVTRRRFS